MDFDPLAIAKINEKKLVAPGSIATSLLSEQKLRAVLENARQIIKVCGSKWLIYHHLFGAPVRYVFCPQTYLQGFVKPMQIADEFGSFNQYCWGFLYDKPMVSKFRYPRQVPVKSPKADMISKDMLRRGFRGVGPTVVYSFMQAAGLTNDHHISCFRFKECNAPPTPRTSDAEMLGGNSRPLVPKLSISQGPSPSNKASCQSRRFMIINTRQTGKCSSVSSATTRIS